MNKPSAVLFDFDGVVVDSFEVHYDAWSGAYFEIFKNKAPAFPTATHAGKAPIIIAEYFCHLGGDVSQTQNLHDLKAELLHTSSTPPKLLPGVRELTQLLKSKNIPFGIASNATKQFIQNSIDQLELDFEIFTGVEDYKFPKPHPEAYLSLANKLSISNHELSSTWVLEDSTTGISAAKQGNMVPIGILTHRPEADLIQAGSEKQFKNLLEVYNFLAD